MRWEGKSFRVRWMKKCDGVSYMKLWKNTVWMEDKDWD